ncbi:glycosyltransferase [Caproicibacterium sp. BJN0003]|nr:glycosyltransferase [Caproicibacterium sp. BJN0003]
MFCEEIIKSKHFHIITNAIESEKFAFNQTIRDEERTNLGISDYFVVGHVGRFYFQKNQEFLVRIFQEIHKRVPKSVLILVGQGEDEEKIHEQVEKLGLKGAVKFLGVCTNMERLYQAMDIFVLPSHFEGLPLVLLEAQANGLPCYVSDCISKEAQVTSSCQYLSLDLPAEKWADKIMSHENNRNPDAVKEIQNSNYDIQKNAKNLEAFFINGD